MRRITLTREEQAIENALLRGEYVPADRKEFNKIARALAHWRNKTVLNIRINNGDLEALKTRAKRHGVKYQTFIAELLHRVAHS